MILISRGWVRLLAKNAIRGNLSLPAVVFVWTGLWNILDIDLPGGTGLWKELGLAALGTIVMLGTRTFFSNAGMESWDEDGPFARLRAVLDTGAIESRDKVILYANSFLAMAGSITFWDGIYTLCEDHVWDNTLRYNAVCAVVGGVGILSIMLNEEKSEDGLGRANGHSGNTTGVGTSRIAALTPAAKAGLYLKGLFGNICGVVFWKGVENIITEESPGSDWTGLVVYVAGVVALLGIGRWRDNCGLEEETWEEEDGNERTNGRYMNDTAVQVTGGESEEEEDNSSPCSSWLPRWGATAIELTAVVAAWTGVEWYNWDDDYIPRTWYRDVVYIFGGLAVLLFTGTFLNLAGTPLGGVARTRTDLVPMLHKQGSASAFDDDRQIQQEEGEVEITRPSPSQESR